MVAAAGEAVVADAEIRAAMQRRRRALIIVEYAVEGTPQGNVGDAQDACQATDNTLITVELLKLLATEGIKRD
jgi:hypothetical protein